MKIIVVGAHGTLGRAVVAELQGRHEIITAGLNSGDIQVDLTDLNSVQKMYDSVRHVDAVIAATGKVQFAEFDRMSPDHYQLGLQNKLMGQVNLVLLGKNHLNEGGSFTLTSGILNRDPIKTGSSAAMVNGALDSFVKAAAIEMPRSLRINIVSPTVIQEAMDKYAPFFRGFLPVSAARAALAYSKSVEGSQTGQIYIVG